jgi:RNA polymerase sigma factor (sigma-70 family)
MKEGGISMEQDTTKPPVRHKLGLDQAIVEQEKLIHWVMRGQWSGGLSYAEVLQEGRIGLWRALQRYDPSRGALSTYAVPAITRAIWQAVARARPHPQEELTPHPPQEAPDLEEHVQRVLVYEALYGLVAALPRRLWRHVIVAHHGLDGDPPQTLSAIGRELGFSPQRAHQLYTEALLWLGHPARSWMLRQLLGRNTVADYQTYLARQRRWQRMRRGRR